MNEPKKFCTMPFIRLNCVHHELYPCCESWLVDAKKFASSIVLKKGYWKSDVMDEFRRSIVDGSYRYCSDSCPFKSDQENPKNSLFKTMDDVKKNFPSYVSDAIEQFVNDPSGKYSISPYEIGLSYDVTCNLACKTCRPHLISEKKFITDLYESRVSSHFGDAGTVYMSGDGDPFASSYYFGLLKNDIRLKFPKATKITLQTNAILLNEDKWNQIHEYNRSIIRQITVSIDASTKDTYAKVRGPHFDTLVKNLEFLKSMKDDGKLDRLISSYTISALNISDVLGFIEFARQYGFGRIEYWCAKNWGRGCDYKSLMIQDPTHPEHSKYVEVINQLKDVVVPGIDILKGYDEV